MFGITPALIKRPMTLVVQNYNSYTSLLVLGRDGRVASGSNTNFTGSTRTPLDTNSGLAVPISSDMIIYGRANGTKEVAYAPTFTRTNTSGSWDTWAYSGGGFDGTNKQFVTTNHGNSYAAPWSDVHMTASSATYTYFAWPAPAPQYANQLIVYRSKAVIGVQGSNSGKIIVWNMPASSSQYWVCSGSSAGDATSGPAYDVRRNRLWVPCANNFLYSFDFDTGNLIESRSWSTLTAGGFPNGQAIHVEDRDEIWVTGYGYTTIKKFHLTNDSSSTMNINPATYGPAHGNAWLIDLVGRNQLS